MNNDDSSGDEITEEERSAAGAELARLARRWILVFCQVEAAMKWRAALEAGGATYRRTCQWIKPDGKPQYSGDRPGIGYESIVACPAPGRSVWNGGGSHGVFVVNKGGDPRTGHQTQKPVALMEILVRLFSDRGELILDPFAGSGTTGVAAIRNGRRFLGWETNADYAAIARRRLAAAREQLEIGLSERPQQDRSMNRASGAMNRHCPNQLQKEGRDGEANQSVLRPRGPHRSR